MATSSAEWVVGALASEGLTPVPRDALRGLAATGFSVEDAGEPGAARVTVVAQYTGQDKYDQWGQAQRLANQVMDALERHGAGFEEIDGREPSCVFDVYPPTGRYSET